jgi:hypothetical protein
MKLLLTAVRKFTNVHIGSNMDGLSYSSGDVESCMERNMAWHFMFPESGMIRAR